MNASGSDNRKGVGEMDDVTIPKSAAICAALHFIELHESAKAERCVNWTAPCETCPIAVECRGDWTETATPIFEAAGRFPRLIDT